MGRANVWYIIQFVVGLAVLYGLYVIRDAESYSDYHPSRHSDSSRGRTVDTSRSDVNDYDSDGGSVTTHDVTPYNGHHAQTGEVQEGSYSSSAQPMPEKASYPEILCFVVDKRYHRTRDNQLQCWLTVDTGDGGEYSMSQYIKTSNAVLKGKYDEVHPGDVVRIRFKVKNGYNNIQELEKV